MSTVIKVENLSKRYLIGHQRQQGEYQTLRDTLTQGVQRFGQRLIHPFKASSGQPMLGADEVEEFWALDDVSFDVKQGDRLGIIGRNGAGKSTLLKILSRITEPTSGSVDINGRVASLLEVGTGFHPELTGRENIFLNGAILGMSKLDIRRKFDEIVAFAEVERFLDTPVKRYSSGMYVRLAFAVAAHLEPEILIVDEVLAVGDAQFQKKCLGKMEEVGKEGRTVLFVSHNISAIQRLCSRAIHLDGGKLINSGEVDAVVEGYLSASRRGNDQKQNLLEISRPKGVFGNIQFSKCKIVNSDGQVTEALRYGEPFSVLMEAVARAEYEQLNFAIGVDTSTGIRVFTAESYESDKYFSAVRNNQLNIRADLLSLKLVPGIYSIMISIRSNRKPLDILNNALEFEVTSQTYKDMVPHVGTWGLVSVDAEWKEL